MKGFLVIGFNNSVSETVSFKDFEQYLIDDHKSFKTYEMKSNIFDSVFGVQLFENSSFESDETANVFLNGKIYGSIDEVNLTKLNIKESRHLIQHQMEVEKGYLKLDGSCAFVKVDESSIKFQNDIEGYKKVFYYDSEDIFCITNNLTYIFKLINKNWKIRKNAVFSYLLQRESKWPLTFIEGIKVLPPLTFGVKNAAGVTLESITYSSLYNITKTNKDDLKDELFDIYEKLAQRDYTKNLAVTLSGGYDSNCLTKLSTLAFGNDFTAVSLGYESERVKDVNVYNEAVYAEKIAKHLKIPFVKYIVGKEQFFSKIDDFVSTIDQPAHDPSSNFMLNHLLRNDGFDAVMSGMGGDACYSSKKNLRIVKVLSQISSATNSYGLLHFLSEKLNYRWRFNYFNTSLFFDKPISFHNLTEAIKLNKHKLDAYFTKEVKIDLYNEVETRQEYYDKILNSSKSDLDIFYSYSIFSNPDEYHADIMAQRNGLDIIMPFVNINPILKLFNANKNLDITNRDFEMQVFKGINEELLLKSKSGFSIPYTEWAKEFLDETMHFFQNLNYFSTEDFDIDKFINDYTHDPKFQNNIAANQLIWKLTIVKKYAELHSISF